MRKKVTVAGVASERKSIIVFFHRCSPQQTDEEPTIEIGIQTGMVRLWEGDDKIMLALDGAVHRYAMTD